MNRREFLAASAHRCEDGRSRVGAIEHMVNVAAFGGAMWASHGEKLKD